MQTRTRLGTILLALAAAALLCAAPSSALAKKPSKKQQKINAYVELLNKWSPYMHKGWKTYTKWADVKTGPTCKERGIRGPGGLGTSAPKMFKDLEKRLKKSPKLAPDKAALAMVDALQKIRVPATEASKYFLGSAYRKDDCKKGKALHPKLVGAWTQYFDNEVAVRKFVVVYNDERAAGDLNKTARKYGKRNRYHYEKLIMDGKALVRTVDTAVAKKPMDTAAIQAALSTFAATQKRAVEIVGKANKRDAQVLYQGGYKQMAKHYGGQLISSVERLLKTYAKRNDKYASPKNLERAIKQVFDTYNRLIDSANKVRFSKSIK